MPNQQYLHELQVLLGSLALVIGFMPSAIKQRKSIKYIFALFCFGVGCVIVGAIYGMLFSKQLINLLMLKDNAGPGGSVLMGYSLISASLVLFIVYMVTFFFKKSSVDSE